MKIMELSLPLLALVALTVTWPGSAHAQSIRPTPEAERQTAALEILKKASHAVLVYADGFCCDSCGVGVRKQISKLDFVDASRMDTGVELHTEFEMATIAIKKGKKAKGAALAAAVEAAGYDPVNLYALKDGKLVITSIALSVPVSPASTLVNGGSPSVARAQPAVVREPKNAAPHRAASSALQRPPVVRHHEQPSVLEPDVTL